MALLLVFRGRAKAELLRFFLGLSLILAMGSGASAVDCKTSGYIDPQAISAGGPDLVVGDPAAASDPKSSVICKVRPGVGRDFYFGKVNILNGGQLVFDEADAPGVNSDFWAKSIIVEKGGALIARNSVSKSQRFGENKAVLTIHLWGADQSVWSNEKFAVQNQGAPCKTPTGNGIGPCGIPAGVWTSNGGSLQPTNATAPDYFYQYGPLYGDASCTADGLTPANGGKCSSGEVGYFGNKVLAVSYGGTLQLFGYKGVTADPKLQLGGAGLLPTITTADPKLQPGGAELPSTSTNKEFGANAANSGVSWIRLADGASLGAKASSLTLENDPGDKWAQGDEIVVTTTDYLPGHSEKLEIGSKVGAQINFSTSPKGLCPADAPSPLCAVATIQWPHNGVRYGGTKDSDHQALIDRLQSRMKQPGPPADPNVDGIDYDLVSKGAETRAAVALLTRSIRIVSEGDTLGAPFPGPDTPARCLYDSTGTNCKYSYGAHMIVRQGFKSVQISGVEFKQMGQGGRIGHYPVHFHMARSTPANTYIADSSVNESMTRWYVVHATLGVTLARNVGFMSIGHGYYLEDAPETDNKFFSNIGILARGAVNNAQNPRQIPGILARNDYLDKLISPSVWHSDIMYPSVFWITNGWNDFIGNMAAGATTCGVGYWWMPASNASKAEIGGAWMEWAGYGALQDGRNTVYAGTAPIKSFYRNYATSMMHSFNATINASDCKDLGVNTANSAAPSTTPFLRSPKSIAPISAVPGVYYPNIPDGAGHRPTYCPPDGKGGVTCTPLVNGGVPRVCTSPGYRAPVNDQYDPLNYCGTTVLDHFTSSFHWAEGNFSAIWLRPQWYLLDNSVVTDVQNGGVSFITGGDYTHSSVIEGYWGVSRNSIFVGHTRKDMKANYFASDIGPFNADSYAADSKNKCDQTSTVTSFCLNAAQGISFPTNAFFGNQRLNNLYDGPTYQEQNAYFDIQTSSCSAKKNAWNTECMYGTGTSKLLLQTSPGSGGAACYVPNAAIGWKSPNGFYYPPAFHSANLQFDKVNIRHFVIEPLFKAPGTIDFGQGGTYKTSVAEVSKQYCAFNPDETFFGSFSAVDRQTELNDDDGSLTGLVNNAPSPLTQTISVNEDNFFTAPIETAECASALGPNALPKSAATCPAITDPTSPPPTVKTSPYDYVSTVIWPRSVNQTAPPGPPPQYPGDLDWWGECSTPECSGVPLYRQFLTGVQSKDLTQATREGLNWAKNGCHTDRTKPECRWPMMRMSGPYLGRQSMTVNNGVYYLDTSVSSAAQKNEGFKNLNTFKSNGQYSLFLIYAKATTKQTYQIYVGNKFNPDDPKQFRPTRASLASFPIVFNDQAGTWAKATPPVNGVTTVTIDLTNAPDL